MIECHSGPVVNELPVAKDALAYPVARIRVRKHAKIIQSLLRKVFMVRPPIGIT